MIPAPVARQSQPSQVMRPAPLKGLNARDPINAVADGYALWLENLIPHSDGLALREGKERWRALSGPVLSLMTWGGTDRNARLFAATQSTIVDVTLANSATAASVTGLSGGIWSSDRMSNAGGHWLICCNGANGVRLYDGTAWSTAAITEADTTTFVDVAVHQSRAFFVKRGSLDLYYLDVGAIHGEAKRLPLAGLCRKGGTLTAVASLTTDGGRNSNDQLVAVTSEGEMIVYAGVSPHRAESWQLVGVFNVGRPVGRRCFVQMGAGLGYLASDGLMPVPDIVSKAKKDQPSAALTDAVHKAYASAYANAPANSNAWAAIESGPHELLIMNLPTQGGSLQLVQSAQTQGWCTFSNMGSNCWAMCGDDIFFGDTSGYVWRYGGAKEGPDVYPLNNLSLGSIGTGDEIGQHLDLIQNPIQALMVDAYSALGSRQRKGLKRVRPHLDLTASARPRFESLAGYRRLPVAYTNALTYTDARRLWDSIAWSGTPQAWEGRDVSIVNQWRSIAGRGQALAMVMAVKSLAPMTYTGADLIYDTGGGI